MVRVPQVSDTQRLCWPARVLLAMALGAFALALGGGLTASLYYVPAGYPALKHLGIEMHQAHSIHTTFAVAWIYLAALAFIHRP